MFGKTPYIFYKNQYFYDQEKQMDNFENDLSWC